METSTKPIKPIIVAGPTASGKTALALGLADALVSRGRRAEIVGCDSVQLYRGFDIGSAKPTPSERVRAPHHMIDIVTWRDDYDAHRYAREARAVISGIESREAIPIIVGGSGLYLRALRGETWSDDLPSDEALRETLRARSTEDLWSELLRLDPKRAQALHPNDRFRVIRAIELTTLLGRPASESAVNTAPMDPNTPPSDAFVVMLDPPRAVLHERINARARAMLAEGILEETRALLDEGCPVTAKPMQSIGYRQCAESLVHAGRSPLGELEFAIAAATRQYAKRQCTWWGKVARDVTVDRLAQGDLLAERFYKKFE